MSALICDACGRFGRVERVERFEIKGVRTTMNSADEEDLARMIRELRSAKKFVEALPESEKTLLREARAAEVCSGIYSRGY